MWIVIERLEEKADKIISGFEKPEIGKAQLKEDQVKPEAGQIKIEERMGKIENEVKILNKTVSFVNSKLINNRARLEILEGEKQSVNWF